MTQRGFPGEPGRPGEEGQPGRGREGGPGGAGGAGGKGGAGEPEGAGGGGGVGGGGGKGAQGEQGPPGERGADGTQPKLRWAPAVGYVLLVLVLGFLIFSNRDLANDTRALTQDNRRMIAEVAAISQGQAEKSYQDCITRNTRATESIKAFGKLVAAHRADGNPEAARVWQSYLDDTRRVPLPSCSKPPAPPR